MIPDQKRRHGGRKELRAFVQDLANAGLRFDLNPTHRRPIGLPSETLLAVEQFWHQYARRMDDSIRERAKAALERK